MRDSFAPPEMWRALLHMRDQTDAWQTQTARIFDYGDLHCLARQVEAGESGHSTGFLPPLR